MRRCQSLGVRVRFHTADIGMHLRMSMREKSRPKAAVVLANPSVALATGHIAWMTGFQENVNSLVAAPEAVSYGE